MIGRPTSEAHQIQHGFNGARKAANAQIPANHDQRNADALQKIGQVPVDLAEFHVAGLQLLVQRVQLFVGRFQLFLRGFQFLIGRLRLFVSRPQFFQSTGVVFHDGLQVLFGCHQFVMQPGVPSVALLHGLGSRPRRAVRGCVLEQHQEMALIGRGWAAKRSHLDRDVFQFAVVLDPEAAFPGDGVGLPGSSDRFTQARNQAFARQS